MAVSPAHATFTIVLTESGGNLVATGSGTINTAGLTKDGSGNSSNSLVPNWGMVTVGSGTADLYRGVSGPSSFGTAWGRTVDSASGDAVFTSPTVIYIKSGYVSGAPLSGSATWNGYTLADLGITPGTHTWSFGAGANADSVVLQVVSGAPAPTPTPAPTPALTPTPKPTPPPIPDLGDQPKVPGINSAINVVDMSKGSGPSITACLLGTIKQLLGANASYLGQTPNGAALIAVGGQTISFHPLAATTQASQGSGVVAGGAHSMGVGTSCGSLTVTPAVANLTDLGEALASMGLSVHINAHGVITATVNGRVYVVRPDYFVTHGTAAGAPRLQFGNDGVLRFTDGAGKVQVLHPGWYDPSGLQSIVSVALGGVLAIQVDGSAVLTRLNGSQVVLVPDMVLTPAPDGLGSSDWVNDRTDHYFYRIGTSYQGLTATRR